MSNQISADYRHIESALSYHRKTFSALEEEMAAFKPRPLSDFEDKRVELREQLRKMNPLKSDAELDAFVNPSIELEASERIQFAMRFSERFMTEQVVATILAHALCEAVINAIIALGLAHNKSERLFPLIEKANVKEKWTVGPRCFHSTYDLQKDSQLYQTLHFLCRRRNALAHYKITLHVDNEKIINGSPFERLSFQDAAKLINRFFRLPYDLLAHARSQIHEPFIFGLLLSEASLPVTPGVTK